MMVKMAGLESKKAEKTTNQYYWIQVGIISMGNSKIPCYAPGIFIINFNLQDIETIMDQELDFKELG